jgi:hypothetical protein
LRVPASQPLVQLVTLLRHRSCSGTTFVLLL